MAGLETTEGLKDKLLAYSKPDPATGCWLWTEYTNQDGYGRIKYQGRKYQAHRLSYHAFVGAIPENLCVLHNCHTPACINPDHLRVGTHQDNMADRHQAGRTYRPVGENNGRAKLTWEQVRAMRHMHTKGVPPRLLVKLFGVSRSAIAFIVRGETWKQSV